RGAGPGPRRHAGARQGDGPHLGRLGLDARRLGRAERPDERRAGDPRRRGARLHHAGVLGWSGHVRRAGRSRTRVELKLARGSLRPWRRRDEPSLVLHANTDLTAFAALRRSHAQPTTMFTILPGTTITLRTVFPSRCLATLGTPSARSPTSASDA